MWRRLTPSRILLSRERGCICICTADIVYRFIGKPWSATMLPAISVLHVKCFNFMQFTERWSVPDSFLFRMNLSWCCKKKTPKTYSCLFSKYIFFCLFHNFMLWIHGDSLWGGFKVLAFVWNSLDLGAKQHHIRANIWFTTFFKVSIASVCPRLAVLIFICDFMILRAYCAARLQKWSWLSV